jgi:TRAP-type mannitol/chloroaromatic compound transport system substrate-binding protein
VRFGGGQELWDELSAGFGLKAMLCGTTGPQMGGWFNKELTSVDSFKGLKYRMPGPGGEVLRRLGAVVVNLPAGGIIDALRSGALDASEFATPWADMALGLHKAAKYYYYPGFHEPGAGLSLAVNKKVWDGMTAHERLVVETAAMAENDRSLAEVVANNAAALSMLMKEPTIDIRKLDDGILQALGKVSGEVLDETSSKDPLARRIHESFIKFRTTAMPWGDVSERGFLNARSLKYSYGRG